VQLRGTQYPLVTGLVARLGRREVFVPAAQVSDFTGNTVEFASAALDLRRFERRDGEMLLRADMLGYRLIEVSRARLVRARDLRLSAIDGGWVLDAADTRWRPRRLPGFLGGRKRRHEARDWQEFEPLIGHMRTALSRGRFTRVSLLKPAEIANLLEEASGAEGTEILGRVHADPELEADVFEELASRLLGARTDAEIAAVLARMRADDAGAFPPRFGIHARLLLRRGPVRLRLSFHLREAGVVVGNSLRWARAIFAVMMTSSSVTLVAGSRVPCSSSTSIPIRNCSRLNREISQSTPIRRPATRACSRVKGACELMPLTLDASPLRRGTSGGHSGAGCCWPGQALR